MTTESPIRVNKEKQAIKAHEWRSEAPGRSIDDACEKFGISSGTYYKHVKAAETKKPKAKRRNSPKAATELIVPAKVARLAAAEQVVLTMGPSRRPRHTIIIIQTDDLAAVLAPLLG